MTDELPDRLHPRQSWKHNTTLKTVDQMIDAYEQAIGSCKASIAHRRQIRRSLGIDSTVDAIAIAYERGIADAVLAVIRAEVLDYHSDIEDHPFHFTTGDEQMIKDAVDSQFCPAGVDRITADAVVGPTRINQQERQS